MIKCIQDFSAFWANYAQMSRADLPFGRFAFEVLALVLSFARWLPAW